MDKERFGMSCLGLEILGLEYGLLSNGDHLENKIVLLSS
jgi:hypothetical protein